MKKENVIRLGLSIGGSLILVTHAVVKRIKFKKFMNKLHEEVDDLMYSAYRRRALLVEKQAEKIKELESEIKELKTNSTK